MIEGSMPYMFGICVFRNSGYCRILHQDFWLMQMDLCLDLELSMEFFFFFPGEVLVSMRRNSLSPGLSFSLDPVIQADTAIKQCNNFSRDSFALETDRDMYI